MRFGLSDEQAALREAVRRYTARSGFIAARRVVDGEESAARGWRSLAADLGLAAVGLPERVGGTGCSLVDQVVVAEELGRVAHPAPYVSIALAGHLLALAGGDADAHLGRIAAGRSLIAPILPLARSGALADPGIEVSRLASTWIANGRAASVTMAADADAFLIAVPSERGHRLFAVEASSPGAATEALSVLDETHPMADVLLSGAIATPVASVVGPAVHDAVRRARVVLAAEQVGVAATALDLATRYAVDRRAFGRAIGSFQSIKHLLVDVLLAVDAASSAVLFAGWSYDTASEEASSASDVAAVLAAQATDLATSICVQVHGALGFSWEHDAHLLLKRAAASRHLLGAPSGRLDNIAADVFASAVLDRR